MRWPDLWVGSFVTALLFDVGRIAIGVYLSMGASTSVFGAAGSVVALLLWLYYAAAIVFFGVEFTQVYLCRFGSRRKLGDSEVHAVPSETSEGKGDGSGTV